MKALDEDDPQNAEQALPRQALPLHPIAASHLRGQLGVKMRPARALAAWSALPPTADLLGERAEGLESAMCGSKCFLHSCQFSATATLIIRSAQPALGNVTRFSHRSAHYAAMGGKGTSDQPGEHGTLARLIRGG